jgi:hypothetical protein
VRAYFVDLAAMVASLDQGEPVDRELLTRLRKVKKSVDTIEAEHER